MTLPYGPPDGTEVLIQWLKDLGEISDERPNGAVMPYRLVTDLGGPGDRLVSRSMYQVDTFDTNKTDAQAAAMETHRRMLYLAGQFVDQQRVTLSNGQVVQADDVEIVESPHWEQWVKDNSIHRYTATYRVVMRYITAT